jgi:hypothetical protein
MTDFETEFKRRSALSHAMAMAPCLHDHFLEMRETAEKSLILHLPDIVPPDREWIDPEEMRAIVNAISVERMNLTIAILKALEHVGDARATPRVEEVRRAAARGNDVDSRRLRAAADLCLQCLRQNSERSMQYQSLLRGSVAPAEVAASTLLRAAHKTEVTASAELLRPGEAEG